MDRYATGPAPVTPVQCPTCGEWHDLLSAPALWGDSTIQMCDGCLNGRGDRPFGYRAMRARPESLYLHYALPERRPQP